MTDQSCELTVLDKLYLVRFSNGTYLFFTIQGCKVYYRKAIWDELGSHVDPIYVSTYGRAVTFGGKLYKDCSPCSFSVFLSPRSDYGHDLACWSETYLSDSFALFIGAQQCHFRAIKSQCSFE